MISPDAVFTVVDSAFYDCMAAIGGVPDGIGSIVRDLTPPSWTFYQDGRWLYAAPPDHIQACDQGFKIHISCTVDHATAVLRDALPLCVTAHARFRVIASAQLLQIQNSRIASRGDLGKFVSIEPGDIEQFTALLQKLHLATCDKPYTGPRILSDRPYGDSKILSYRYGSLGTRTVLAIDGTRYRVVTAPDGQIARDDIKPFFSLPYWAKDPFRAPGEAALPAPQPLAGRYQLSGIIRATPCGCVYAGTNLSDGSDIVVKEARPLTGRLTRYGWRDATRLLEHEASLLEHLRDSDCVPTMIDFCIEHEHRFLVQKRIRGQMLRPFCAHWQRMVAPYAHRHELLASGLANFRALACLLIDLMVGVHRAGVIAGEVTVHNFMVYGDPLRVALVDLKSAMLVTTSEPSLSLATEIGGVQWRSAARRYSPSFTIDDDWFGLGIVLLAILTPSADIVAFDPNMTSCLLCRLARLGIPRAACEAVEQLINGGPDAGIRARSAVEELP